MEAGAGRRADTDHLLWEFSVQHCQPASIKLSQGVNLKLLYVSAFKMILLKVKWKLTFCIHRCSSVVHAAGGVEATFAPYDICVVF